jgi:hypothetical protein
MNTIGRRLRWTVSALVALSLALVSTPSIAAATTTEEPQRSPLCAYLDAGWSNTSGAVRANFTLGVWGPWSQLYGGETITFTPGTVAHPEEVVLSLSVRTNGRGFDPVAVSDVGATSVSWTAPRMTLSGLRSTVSTGDFNGMTWSCDARPAGPATAIDDLRGVLGDMALHDGLARALDDKLALAWDSAWNDDHAGACVGLADFDDLAAAQDGKKLDPSDADQLSEATSVIATALGC